MVSGVEGFGCQKRRKHQLRRTFRFGNHDDGLNQFVAGKGPLVLIGFDDGLWQGGDCWAVGRVVPVLWNSDWSGAVDSL